MKKVKATVDIQFYPKTDDFNYGGTDKAEELKRLDRVLKFCDELRNVFNAVLPPLKKKNWWKSGLMLTATDDNQITFAEIKEKVSTQLAKANLTAQQLRAVRQKLSLGRSDRLKLQLATAGGGEFPPAAGNGNGSDTQGGIKFGMEASQRIYVKHPDGTVECVVIGPLTVNDQPLMLTDSVVTDENPNGGSQLDVSLAVHFDV